MHSHPYLSIVEVHNRSIGHPGEEQNDHHDYNDEGIDRPSHAEGRLAIEPHIIPSLCNMIIRILQYMIKSDLRLKINEEFQADFQAVKDIQSSQSHLHHDEIEEGKVEGYHPGHKSDT
jgi:hypothetical protein